MAVTKIESSVENERVIPCACCKEQRLHRWQPPRYKGDSKDFFGMPVAVYSGGGWICMTCHPEGL